MTNLTEQPLPTYVRHYIGNLPMTGKVLHIAPPMTGMRDLYAVNVMGYSLTKVEYWPIDECEEYHPSPFMQAQLNDWLALANRPDPNRKVPIILRRTAR